MDPVIAQLLSVGFLAAIGLTAYEMHAATQPPFCAECSHCRAERHEQRRRQAEMREQFARRNGIVDNDEDDRRR
ncbi:MAG TPA: hypothetical protein VIV06_01745 [Candidatus Limnocylindrales bacterium]